MQRAIQRTPAGFTLIELLTALAILVLLSSVAVPSFSSYIANRRVQAAAVDLLAGLNYARTEAIKRNTNVYVKVADSSDWASGWAVVSDIAKTYAACQTIAADPVCLRVQSAQDRISITGGPAVIDYAKSGRLAALGSISFTLCDSEFSGQVFKRVLRVDSSGRSHITVKEEKCDA